MRQRPMPLSLAHPFCPAPCFTLLWVAPRPTPGSNVSCPCSAHFHPQGDRVRCTEKSGQRDAQSTRKGDQSHLSGRKASQRRFSWESGQ